MGSRVTLVDDLDESVETDVETVVFGYKGLNYEIDLGLENRVRLDELLAEFIETARIVEDPRRGGSPRPRQAPREGGAAGRPLSPNAERNSRIRAWASANGYSVVDKGRIAKEVVSAYEKANPEDVPA
jgi:hypothetical protein